MSVYLKTLVYNYEKGYDNLKIIGVLDIDPSAFTSAEEAASALFEKLDTFATKTGYSEGSVGLWTPEDAEKRGYGRCWMVTWEGGPYEWAIYVSMEMHGPWGYTEPHHSFDLCFINERKQG
jgi:hypothetical protein